VVQKHIAVFHVPFLKMLKELGYETVVAAKNDYDNHTDCIIPYCDVYYDIPFERSPFSLQNLKAYRALKKIIDSNHFDIIHCHTPVGSVLGRLCAIPARKKGTKVFYTAHGFHFYKGAPLKNWLLYYPVECLCAHFTDVLITINQEDYNRAKHTMHAKCVEYIPGVGIDANRFCSAQVDRIAKRADLGVPTNCTVITSVGELNRNKNHATVIRALALLNDPSIHYLIVGKGELYNHLTQLASSLGLANQVHLLGYRSDIAEIYKASDICIFPSIREGLGLAALEGMASGLPLIISDNRGAKDYAIHGENAYVCPWHSSESFSEAIKELGSFQAARMSFGQRNIEISRRFDISHVEEAMRHIYTNKLHISDSDNIHSR
jgi:glycosyltransferase EpsD